MTSAPRGNWALLAAALAAIGLGGAQAGEPPRGPVAAWTFAEDLAEEAGRWRDQLSARDAAGRVVMPRFADASEVPGVWGKAVALGVRPGDAACLTACTSPDVRLGAAYTLAVRVRPTQLGAWGRLVLHWGGGTQHAYHLAVHNGQASIYHGQADGKEAVAEGGRVEPARWHHLAAVAERNDADPAKSTLRIYLDGRCVGTAPYDGTIRTLEGEGLGIGDAAGAPGDAARFHGYVDDVRLWDRALSAQEVAALCAERARSPQPPAPKSQP